MDYDKYCEYYYRSVDRSFFDDENNWPKNFNSDTDLMVGVFEGGDNPILFAYQAQKLKKKHREDVVDIMFQYASDFDFDWDRSKESVQSEWKYHMYFALFSKRAQDVDFDKDGEDKSFSFYIEKAWDAFWGK